MMPRPSNWQPSRPLSLLLFALTAGLPASAQTSSAAGNPDPFSMSIESLLNVQVSTASKFLEDLSDAPGVISVVTSDELRRFGGMTVMEVLERVPGLFYTADSFTDRSMISARGDQTASNSKHVLYLINGRPTREILEGGIATDLLESFPVEALERIEVIKGPGSVLYGSNAFSGVVNLITRKADGNSLVVNGMSAGGPSSATSGHFSLEHGNLTIAGAGQYHADPSWPVYYQSFFGNSNANVINRSDGAFIDVGYKGLRLMSSWGEHRAGYVEGLPGDGRWRRGFADLGYAFAVTANWDMNLNLTYTRTSLDASKSIPYITRDSYETVAEWTNTVHLGARDRLIFGYAFNHMGGLQTLSFPPYTPEVDGSQSGNAAYAQVEHRLRSDLTFIGGMQGNKVGALAFDLVPRIGIVWTPAHHWDVKALYSQAFHAPMLHETLLHYAPPPGEIGVELLGDRNLKAEKIATIDLAVTRRKERFEGTIDYFHSHMINRIVLGPDPDGVWRYHNLGPVTFQGIELEGKYYATSRIFITASVIGQRSKDNNGTVNVTPIPNIAGKAGVSYEAAYGVTAGIFDVLQGSIPGMAGALNPKPTPANLISANFRLDLSKRFLHNAEPGLALVAHGENLLNHPVWLPNIPDMPTDTIFAKRGRTVYTGLEFSFGRR